MLASKQSVGKIMGVTTILGVDRHNIKKAMERCLQLDASNDVFWIIQRQAKRFDSLPHSLKELVIQWWTTYTTISPIEKDVVK